MWLVKWPLGKSTGSKPSKPTRRRMTPPLCAPQPSQDPTPVHTSWQWPWQQRASSCQRRRHRCLYAHRAPMRVVLLRADVHAQRARRPAALRRDLHLGQTADAPVSGATGAETAPGEGAHDGEALAQRAEPAEI